MSVSLPISLANSHRISTSVPRSGFSFAEQFALAFFAYLPLAACWFGLAARELWILGALNTLTAATLWALSRNARRAPWLAVTRDLLPAVLILLAYRESGLLLRPDPAHHLDGIFIPWDRLLLESELVRAALKAGAPWLEHYLEFAYLLCYPFVPLGFAAICLAPRRSGPSQPAAPERRAIDGFWATVLLATLFCYAVYPFFPLTPPRVLFHDVPGPHIEPLLRKWNFWLLDHYSVQACIFPSGHVAAVTAVALAVRKHAPRPGALFLFVAASVAVATVYGRYHYAADAVVGALVGVAAYCASNAIQHRAIE